MAKQATMDTQLYPGNEDDDDSYDDMEAGQYVTANFLCNSQDLRCKRTSQSSQMFVCVIGVIRVIGVIGVIVDAQTNARRARQCETSNREHTRCLLLRCSRPIAAVC